MDRLMMASSNIWMIMNYIYIILYMDIYVFWAMMRRWWHPPKDFFFDDLLGNSMKFLASWMWMTSGVEHGGSFQGETAPHLLQNVGFPTFCIGCSPNSRIPVCHSACSTTTLGS